jgi:hypothetical protein
VFSQIFQKYFRLLHAKVMFMIGEKPAISPPTEKTSPILKGEMPVVLADYFFANLTF